MTDQRNNYGFPFGDLIASLASSRGATMVSIAGRLRYPVQQSKLVRAQAIAAEVRARKFPPVRRLTPAGEK